MRPLVAVLGVVWVAANLLMSYFMVTSSFVSKTAMKEGILSQAALLLGGVSIEILSIALIWQCVRMLRERGSGFAGPNG